jgi:uncharacterized protein YdcH (DUF465 family)
MVKANLSEDTVIATPLRNVITIIAAVAVGTWAYFGLIERLNNVETGITMMQADLEKNTEFRIKWPRGEMGSLPADNEQFMLIEHLSGQLDKMITDIESGNAPYDQQQKPTLDFYEKRISKLEERIDALKQRGNN